MFIINGCEQQSPDVVNKTIIKPQISKPALNPVEKINHLADQYYATMLSKTPEIAYFSGIDIEAHDGMEDNSPAARKIMDDFVNGLLLELESIDAGNLIGQTEWITHAYLLQTLRSAVAIRICRNDLWNVNHMGGWHSNYSQLAQLQPIGTAPLREQSLLRWSKLDEYADQEVKNLQAGLKLGYSAPQTVVSRVIDQIDGLLNLAIEQSPFYSPAVRDNDGAFAAATYDIVTKQIHPALLRYRDYLANTYLESARQTLAVIANPDGEECYKASLQFYTTLNHSGKDIYELGKTTVAANKAEVIKLGKAAYNLSDFKTIIDTSRADPADKFKSREELLEFSRTKVLQAGTQMSKWVGHMPEQAVEVVPFLEHEEGTGRAAHYNNASADRPGEYRIPLFMPEAQSRGNAEKVAFHETWPGHHLQVSVSQSVEGLHPVTQIIWFSGPGEGWARYSESLAEEMGLYTTKTGPILRRAWPARGMVVDPGIHLFGWTREQAVDYINESGGFSGENMVDRIAILPGQLTAYDSGGLEIIALRKQAEKALGENFDIREFHDQILENGTIPLIQLRVQIENWIATNKK